MALDNYCITLGVAQSASTEDVQKAISEKRRERTPRTGHPKRETRQLAEQTIKSIMGGLVFGEIVTIIAMFVFFGIGQGFVVLGILCLALAVLWVVLFVRSHRVPGWKWNWKQSPPYVRQTGLQ